MKLIQDSSRLCSLTTVIATMTCLLVISPAFAVEPAPENQPEVDKQMLEQVLSQISAPASPVIETSAATEEAELTLEELADLIPPPTGSSDHLPGKAMTIVHDPVPRKLKRSALKPGLADDRDYASNTVLIDAPEPWQQLRFSSGSFAPDPGLDPRLVVEAARKQGSRDSSVYGFLLMEDYLSGDSGDQLGRLGATVLGPHGNAYKVKLPSDTSALEAIANLPFVHWVGFSQAEQKLSFELRARVLEDAAQASYPVMINLFDGDREHGFGDRLESAGAVLGAYDPELLAYTAAVPLESLDAILELDFVLFVELLQPTVAHHSQSTPLIGGDYIRPGGTGSRFDGSSTIVGIMDSGFMLGTGAAVMHQDLNKNGCGVNFSTDTAGVWNDQNGHGTHVLTTIGGTGTADSRYRGMATGIGNSSAVQIRAAKVFTSAGSGSSEWTRSAMDFMDDASACGSGAPHVINYSGGSSGVGLVGTDESARKLDTKTWTYGQLYVVSAGNSGSGASTIGTPAVAKNALTVGNVLDFGHLTTGDIWTSSSRGPTGDGRMKPNVSAPGRWVRSADAGTTNQYVDFSGTSMAAPHVTGLAATLMQHYPDFKGRPYLLRAFMMASSLLHDDLTSPADNDAGGTRPDYGIGRVSSYAAHWARSNANGWNGYWAWGTSNTSAVSYTDVAVPSGTDRLMVVLTWDEPAASAGAATAVIDDIDLWVDRGADCTGAPYPGGCGEYNSLSTRDNVEYVIINNPPAGTYRLKAAPWSVSAARPVAIAAVVIQGDPTPSTNLTATASTSSPTIGATFTVTTTVSASSWIASGVHLARTSFPAGLNLVSVRTLRKDNVNMSFGTDSELTLGNIHEGDTRSAVWTFQALTTGNKTLSFRSWSENGGTTTKSLTVMVGSPIFTDGFESGNLSSWSTQKL